MTEICLEKIAGDFRKEMGTMQKGKMIVPIGTIKQNKGQLDFMEAASIVCERINKCFFIIIGNSRKDIFRATISFARSDLI